MEKCICPICSEIIECDKPQETIYKSQKDFLTSNVQVIRVFLGPERLLKTQILKKNGSFPVNKCICPIFSQIVECDNLQEMIYKGWKDILTVTVVVKRSFLGPERLLKTQVFEKGAILPMEKFLCQAFVVLSTLTNLREQLKKVRKVFWKLLWKILDHFCGI